MMIYFWMGKNVVLLLESLNQKVKHVKQKDAQVPGGCIKAGLDFFLGFSIANCESFMVDWKSLIN